MGPMSQAAKNEMFDHELTIYIHKWQFWEQLAPNFMFLAHKN